MVLRPINRAVVSFHWKRESITPRLQQAVGAVVLEWTLVDEIITDILGSFWLHHRREDKIPRPFDIRRKLLRDFGGDLYRSEPDELRIFAWYLDRLSRINSDRDDICHGIPGIVTLRKKSYACLAIRHPSKETRYKPISIGAIERFAASLMRFHSETGQVGQAIGVALQASSRSVRVWKTGDDQPHLLTPENRHPRLPRQVPPPPSFRV